MRHKAKYCGETIRTVYDYISVTATTNELSNNYNISEDYLKEIFGYLELMLTKNEE